MWFVNFRACPQFLPRAYVVSSACTIALRVCGPHPGGVGMPRKARLFTSSSGSAARGFLKFRANIPPRWIQNAQTSRKRIEPEIVEALRSLISMRKNRPRAQVALKKAQREFKAALSRWETAYNKENFYRGIRILLELQRNGSSKL